jgi:hypothetical protein
MYAAHKIEMQANPWTRTFVIDVNKIDDLQLERLSDGHLNGGMIF